MELKASEVLIASYYLDEYGDGVDVNGNYDDSEGEVYSLCDYSLNELRRLIHGTMEGQLTIGTDKYQEGDRWIAFRSENFSEGKTRLTHEVAVFADTAVLALLAEVAQ